MYLALYARRAWVTFDHTHIAEYALRMKVWLGFQGRHRLFVIERWRMSFGIQPVGAILYP
jgi:hypothetical protein